MSIAALAKSAPTQVLLFDGKAAHSHWGANLQSSRPDWLLQIVLSGQDFIHQLNTQSFDLIVISTVDIQSCSECITRASTLQPQAVRALLHPLPQPVKQLPILELAHQCISDQQPLTQALQDTDQLIRLNRLIHKNRTRDYALSLGKLPSPPGIYRELSNALTSEQTNAGHISDIVSKDPALAAKVLRTVNSAYFGLNRRISNIQEAVTLLGIRTLRALSISGQLLSQYPQHRNWSYFSFETISRRSVMVARMAQHICQQMQADSSLTDQAFIGGLLHDLGLLVFASQDSQSYRKILVMSAQTNTHICVVEKKLLGLFHGEMGAFLLSQWRLPPPVVEAVLLHHTPQLSISSEFSPLTAVHIADALLPQAETEIGALLGNNLHQGYLERTGVSQLIPRWQQEAERLLQNA